MILVSSDRRPSWFWFFCLFLIAGVVCYGASAQVTRVSTGDAHVAVVSIQDRVNLDQTVPSVPIQHDALVSPNGVSVSASEMTDDTINNVKNGVVLQNMPYVTAIQFQGNDGFSHDTLVALVQTPLHKTIDLDTMRRDVKAIQAFYQEEGYTYSRVYNIEYPKKKPGPLVFKIGEGRLRAIVLTGNVKTKDYVILREMVLKPGMPLTKIGIKNDLRRIYNLNHFTALEPDIVPADQLGMHDLTITFTEKPPSAFNLGGGYSERSGFFMFTDLKTDNFLGKSQRLSLKGQFGGEIVNYEFRFHEPWMWVPRRSLSYGIWHRTGRLDVFSAQTTRSFESNQTSTGMDIGVGIPLSYSVLLHHQLKYEVVQQKHQPDYDYVIQSYAAKLSKDTRDVWFAPRSGYYMDIRAEKAFNTRVKALDFEKYDATAKKFFPLFKKQTIATRLSIGYLEGRDQTRVTGLMGYIVGSQDSVRGYDSYFAFGSRRIVSSVEYRWLLNHFFQISVFVDAGTAPQSVDEERRLIGGTHNIYDIGTWRVGKGVGFYINSPIGPLRFDFGNDDMNEWRIQFNFGQAF